MLYGPDGSTVGTPPTVRADRQHEREEEVRQKLKSIDSLLDIQYIEWAGRYSLICNWPQSDERWKLYQSGEISAAYDSLGWFCEDLQDPTSLPVAVDSIERLILERLASCDNTQQGWKARMGQIVEKNAKLRKDRKQVMIDRAEEVARTLAHAAGHREAVQLERMLEEVSGGKY